VVIVPLLVSVLPTLIVKVLFVKIVPLLFIVMFDPKIGGWSIKLIVPALEIFPLMVAWPFTPQRPTDAPEAIIRPPIAKDLTPPAVEIFVKSYVPAWIDNVPVRAQAKFTFHVAAPDNASITNTSPAVVKLAGDPPLAAPEVPTHDDVVVTTPALLPK
jgi:hypothetical protein